MWTAMTKKELIEFLNELVELASEENKTKAVSVKEKFISDFEKSYEYRLSESWACRPKPSGWLNIEK